MTLQAMTTTGGRDLVTGDLLAQAGQAANRAAAKHVFAEYRKRKAANTTRRQNSGLALFARYLLDVAEIPTGDLTHDPQAWAGVTWGLVQGFVKWQLDQGYTVGSTNIRLSTVKTYARLAAQAGALDRSEFAMIKAVEGYRYAEAINLDEERKENGQRTRLGDKNATAVTLTQEQAERLKSAHAPDGQGRRDRLLMCLLVDWGLRVSEIADLTVENLQVDTLCASLRVYRRKTKQWATLDLTSTPDTLQAARAYLAGHGAPTEGALLMGSTRRGALTGDGLSTRAINKRVGDLGQRIGVLGLSPHDLRHYAATYYGRYKSTRELMDVFGWSSASMAVRYQEAARTIRV